MYSLNAPPNSFVLFYTLLSEIVTTGRQRRSLKYNKDIPYQKSLTERSIEDLIHSSNQQ